ncbi:MAG: hypothetical protein K6G70_04800 [Bacteroidaceae bacterium]|nr:hypothetical protein [Bacteroidaceae bacterium]
MKKIMILAAGLAMLCTPQLKAQDDDNIFKHYGLSVGFGLTGITIDASTMITDYVGVRAGADILPSLKYSADFEISGMKDAKKQAAAAPAPNMQVPNIPDKLSIEAATHLGSGHILIDGYPFKGSSFHVTAGAYFCSSEPITLYNKDNGAFKDVKDFNDRKAPYYDGWKNVADAPKIGMQMGDYFLEPDVNGNLEASIRVNGFQPYLGIGFGRAVPLKSRVSCQFDLGVKFWSTPSIYLQDHELTAEDLNGEGNKVFDIMSKITVFPVMTLLLVGRII